MFCKHDDPKYLANETAKYFSSDEHKTHGKRIGRDEARTQKLEIRNLEEDQGLQDNSNFVPSIHNSIRKRFGGQDCTEQHWGNVGEKLD